MAPTPSTALGLALTVMLCSRVAAVFGYDFRYTSLSFEPARIGQAVEITLKFEPMIDLTEGDTITVNMPRLTAGQDIRRLKMTNNYYLTGRWYEGDVTNKTSTLPYPESTIVFEVNAGRTLLGRQLYTIHIIEKNGITIKCGFATNDPLFTMYTNSSSSEDFNAQRSIESVPQIGDACSALNSCNGHGDCDHCHQTCDCWEGYGFSDGRLASVNVGCAERTCPLGYAFADVPSSSNTAHALAECSNAGRCNRSTGECECFAGFDGDSCQRRKCPNDCSGHGTCLSLSQLAGVSTGLPLSNTTWEYGSLGTQGTTTWDHSSLSACLCDSSWKVGLSAGETQDAEYFGADCSLRHCPSGDDPETPEDETDCTGKSATGGHGTGTINNKCQVDCSNRGLCDYGTGNCECFAGYAGEACETKLAWIGDAHQ